VKSISGVGVTDALERFTAFPFTFHLSPFTFVSSVSLW
jgi:hypothetical protein